MVSRSSQAGPSSKGSIDLAANSDEDETTTEYQIYGRNVMSSKSRSHVSSRAGGSKPPRTPGPKVGYNTIDKASKPTTLDGYRTSGPFRPPLKQVAQSRRPLTATNPHESHHGEASSSSHPYGNGGDNQVLNGQPIPRSGNDPGAFMQHQRRSPDFHDNPPSSSRTATSGHKRNTSSLSSRSALFAPVLSNPSSVTRGRQIRSQGSSSPTKISRHRSPEQDLSIQNSSDEDTIQDPLGPFRKELEAEGIYQMSSQKIGPSKFPSRAPYVELQEKPDREPPSTTNRRIDLSEKGSVKKLVKNLEEKAQDDEWAINQGPPRHDIHRSTATSSQVSSKPVAGQQTRPPTDIRPGQPVPPSLSKSAPTHSATVQHMADVQRAWMLVGNDYGFPFPLKVVNIGISGDCIQLDSGPSIGTVLVNPLDLAQCSIHIDKSQCLLILHLKYRNARELTDLFTRCGGGRGLESATHNVAKLVIQFNKASKEAVDCCEHVRSMDFISEPEDILRDEMEETMGTCPPSESSHRSSRSSNVDTVKIDRAVTQRISRPSLHANQKPSDTPREKQSAKPKEIKDKLQTRLSFLPEDRTEKARSTGPRRSDRNADHTVGKYKEIEGDDVPEQSNVKPLSTAEKSAPLFDYPPDGRAVLQITRGERYRVENQDFLNDILVEFGLRLALSKLPPEVQAKVHLFNSFFYEKISDRKQKGGPKADPDSETLPPWPGYDAVKKWTKKANIFDKDFLIVPINEDYHWYLAVIYRPRGFLQQAKSVETLEKDEPDEKGSTDERGKSEPVDPDDSIDPIDSLHGPMDIDEASNEIQSLTLSAQGSPEKPTNDDVEMDDQAKSSDEKPNWPILDGDDCWIFTFDSLGGSHKAVLSHLNRYLLYEAHDKGRLTGLSLNAGRYVEAKVPGQPNFSDCGLFLVHYASQLLKHTEETLRFLQRPPPRYKAPNRLAWEQDMKTVWREDETKAMRQAWLQDIDDITGIWNSIQGIKPEEPIATAPAQMVPEIPPPSLPPQLSQQRTVSTRRRTESPIKQRDPVTETRHLSVPLNSDPANSNLAPELFNLSRSRQATSPPSRSRSRSHSRTMSAAIDPELYESEVPEPVEDRVEDAAESRARSTSMSDYDEEDNFVGSPLDNLGGQRSTPSNGIYHSSPHRSNRVAGSRLGQSRIPSYDDRAERSVSTEEEQEPVEPRDGDLVDSTEITPRPAMRASSLDPSRRTGIPLITYSSRSKRPAEPSPVNQRKHPRLSEPPSDIDPDIMRADEDVQHHLPVPPAKPGHSRSASDQAPLAPDPATGKSVEAAILVDSSDEE